MANEPSKIKRRPLQVKLTQGPDGPSLQAFPMPEVDQEMATGEVPSMEMGDVQRLIYVWHQQHEMGPFEEKDLRRHWANGVVNSGDLVWMEGMEEWMVLRDFFGVPAPAAPPAKAPSGLIPRAAVDLTAKAPDTFQYARSTHRKKIPLVWLLVSAVVILLVAVGNWYLLFVR